MQTKTTVETHAKTEVLDVTQACLGLLPDVADGIALFYVPHTTAALLLCEDDAELRQDIVRVAETWLAGSRPFSHIRKNNPNAEAHILSAFGGSQVLVAIVDGRADLGTYQNLLLLEMDGPKTREIRCQVIAGQ
jgi:secondary thiamine-phosphate synthase enzyme